MKTVTKTALANVKQNKGRNFLCGCAIALTTFLIFVVLTVGYGMIRVQLASVDAYYPTYHIMFRQVSEKNTKALQVHNDIEEIGLRMDLGQIIDDDATIIMTAMDNNGIRLNKAELEEGTFPKNEKDIVVSKGVLEELGIQGKLGDEITIPYQIYEKDGMGYAKEDTFRICGFMESSDLNKEKKMYFVMNSMEYAKQMIPEADREYRVMFRLADAEHMTTDEIEERGKEIGEDFGVPEGNVVENREYLVANYTDPSFVKGMIVVIVMVVLAGILTIYSIYYVSMIPKVQEYGKLKAIGSTKRQIRQMVFREGMLVTALALPVGLLISSFLSRWIMKQMITFMAGEDPLMQVAAELVKNGEVSLLHWWIYAITIMAVLFTSAVSLAKPMRIAAKVSPIEAMRYQGLEKRGKKVRKGYQNLTIFRLTKANMARNKKRTGITIVTLGATGILFMVVATILSCAAPKEIARKDIESDYKIELETWGGDKMNPDRDWRQVQQNNPLTKAFIDQVRDVDGVEEVKVKTFMNGKIPKLSMDGEIWDADIIGLDASYAETLEKGEIQGHVTYEELEKGDKILMSANMLYWFPELKVGDSLKMVLNMGDDQVEKTFEIGAIGDYYESLGGSSFYLPQSVLEKMNPNNLNYTLEITVNDQKKNSAYQELQALADNSEYLVTGSYEEQLQKWEKNMRLMSVLCYAFLIILGGIGIMNLVNTMMNSIYTRRRELGMIQAIGMSEKQLIRMLQLEGIIYTLGTLAVSVGIGSLVGYGAFLYAKTKHMFQISEYHFPVVPAVLLICVVAFLQVLLTYGVSANFRKLSLIDRIRYAEVLNMGDDQVEKTFEIGAIGDYYESLGGSSFYLPQSVLEKMNPNNLNYTLEITVNDQKKNSAYQELQALADNSEYLVTGSYEEQLQKWEKNMRLMSVLCYAFLIILGGIGIMNLVNTMMNSIYTRRRELGMIQAIGMSEKQLIRMLQLEGIIYTLGTLAVSVGIGSLVGYGAFLYAKTKHMFQISEYHFPVVPAVLLICVVAFLQVLLTYGVSANFRKLSLIDRIRYAE